MAKRDLHKIVLATYREPKPKAKRCGTCEHSESYTFGATSMCYLSYKNVSTDHGVCDAWEKRD